MTLHVPALEPDAGVLTAALAYAKAGWYVGPARAGTKDPGSVLGKGWQRRTSRDPQVLVAWFAGTDHGVFLHCGRSGALVFDVDTPEKLHPLIAQAVEETSPPWQSTRPEQPTRRHYLFAQPVDRMLGNSLGRLAGGWGEVRGQNGVIVVAPSPHAEGGRYDWGHIGAVPPLPAYLLAELPDALDAADAATDEQVRAFLERHQDAQRDELLTIHLRAFENKVAAGESRHHTMTGHLSGAMKEARLGCYPADLAADTLQSAFLAAVAVNGSGKQGDARTPAQARSEWNGLLAWAVAQAEAADPGEIRARLAEKVPDVRELVTIPDPAPVSPSLPLEAGAGTTEDQAATEEPDDVVRRRFPRLDLAALLAADRPAREWVIPGLIPSGASVALVAPAGAGKSLLLLAAMIAVARGDARFAGIPITRRRVLLVDMENTEDDLTDRLRALGVTPGNADDLADLIPIHLPPLAPLDTFTGAAELAAILEAYDIRPGDVVVLDSLQRVISGAENDSDTMRAFYRHTAVMLKRLGVTVIRTDNTGKDTEKGARGTSGKRDDVDVELIVIPDVDRPGLMHIRPGKVRLPGIEPVRIQRDTDDDTGLLTFTTAGDPFRAKVTEAVALLAGLEVPPSAGERPAADALKSTGRKFARNVIRAAVKERRDPLAGAPFAHGAPLGATDSERCADDPRRSNGAPRAEETNPQVRGGFDCAEGERRTDCAPSTGAPSAGAPPLPLSKERRTGALTVPEGAQPPVCGLCEEPNPDHERHLYCPRCWPVLVAAQQKETA